MTFLQDQSSGAPDPYGIGEELVLFLRWLPNEQTFALAWSMGAVGKPDGHWLADLRKLSNEK